MRPLLPLALLAPVLATGCLRPPPPAGQVETPPLTVYATALGLTDEAVDDMAGGVA